jgi:hypothetical protein
MKSVSAAIVRNLSREPPPQSAGNLILDVPAYGCRINNRKELHFLFRPRLRGNNDKVSSGLCAGFNGREGDRARTGHCQLFRGPRQSPSAFTRTAAASGGRIQQSERASDQRLASLCRDGWNPVAYGCKAECNKIVEGKVGRGRQPGKGGAYGFQRLPLIRS